MEQKRFSRKSKLMLINNVENSNNMLFSDNIQHHFEKFIFEIKSNINKSKYRKVLEDIEEKKQKFEKLQDYWLLYEYKLKSIRKIIERKFNKSSNLKNIEDWLIRFDDTIEEWFSYLSEVLRHYDSNLEDQNNLQLELLVKNALYQCYNYAILMKEEKRLADTIGFLALGERLIKFIFDITHLPETMNIIQKIYLFISSLLTADGDYVLAKQYQANCLKTALKELYLRTDYNEGINIEKMNKKDLTNLHKCITNIIISFYQKGICEENLGNLLKGVEAYKQAKWFSVNFIQSYNFELCSLMEDIELRALNYINLLNNIKNNMNIIDQNTVQHKNFKSKLYHNEEERLQRFNDGIKRIESMTFQEFDDNEVLVKKSENIKYILSTVKTLENLMSSKFRDLVKVIKNKDLSIGNMNKDLKDKIQRKLNEVKAEKLYEETEKRQKAINQQSNYFNAKESQEQFKSSIKLNQIKNKPKPKEEEIQTYHFNDYISNKTHQNKLNYLNSLELKENLFQKNVLEMKKQEKIIVDKIDYKKISDECEIMFNKLLNNTKKTFIEDEKANKKKEIFLEERKKQNFEEAKLLRQVIKSFNYKSLDKLKQIQIQNQVTTSNNIPLSAIKPRETKGNVFNFQAKDDNNIINDQHIQEKEKLLNNQLNTIENNTLQLKKIIDPIHYNNKKAKSKRTKDHFFSKSTVNKFITLSQKKDEFDESL